MQVCRGSKLLSWVLHSPILPHLIRLGEVDNRGKLECQMKRTADGLCYGNGHLLTTPYCRGHWSCSLAEDLLHRPCVRSLLSSWGACKEWWRTWYLFSWPNKTKTMQELLYFPVWLPFCVLQGGRYIQSDRRYKAQWTFCSSKTSPPLSKILQKEDRKRECLLQQA